MRIHPNTKILTTLVFIGFFAFAKAQSGQVNISQNAKIPELLKLKTELSINNELGDRYKIQIHSGNSIQTAATIKRRFLNKIGTWEAKVKYETPNYKVWVGNFRNRLEADRALLSIKKEFPNALIFKPDPNR
ncbi:SPOR domain-containing protein [Dokdonia sp.]|uniref:SPOR domain-containing protein n=1 Tax=Dokdonia sp. TaxID=2024995 RepID=UPI00326380F5